MKNLARKKENISCLHSQNCQVAIYGAICLFSFFALFLLSNVCTHAVPNAFVSVFASVCLCLWGVSCFCCCGRCERVCVCGVGVPVCYIFYSFVRLKRACWTLVAIRIEPGPLVERIRQRGFSRGLRVTGSGGQGVRGAAHIEQKNAITHETQQGKQSGQTGISSREECTITS